jgi:hypothetical protein
MEVYMQDLADPGGRYAVQRVSHLFTKRGGLEQHEAVAKALNEGDAKGWRLVQTEYTDLGVLIVWDKPGRYP